MDPIKDTSGAALHKAFIEVGANPETAYNAVEGTRDMAAANLIAQMFERIDGLRRELNTLKWVIGIGVAILATLMALLR